MTRSDVTNLSRLLRLRAGESPDLPLYTFLHEGEEEAERLTAGELDRRARGIAAVLAETCAPGDRVLLLFPAGLDFIAAFFGCLYAGTMAVPAYPPHPRRGQPRLAAIARSALAAAPDPVLARTRRGSGNLTQLLAEVGKLSPEEARGRLAERERREGVW